jgi:hypothetical protein
VFYSWASNYLVFPSQVYKVDFRKRLVRSVFVPQAGETVQWATRWENEQLKLVLAFILTDRSIHIVNDAGFQTLTLPLAADLEGYQIGCLGRLENPTRYWVWYDPAWYLALDVLETTPAYVVMYDNSGQECAPRQPVAPPPGLARETKPRTPPVEASAAHGWLGLLTPPVEGAILVGATQQKMSEVRATQGAETSVMLQVLIVATQHFLPGVRWLPQTHPGIFRGFEASMALA